MTAPFVISNEQARALILARTGLSEARATRTTSAIPTLIESLGYVQLDPIRVVERAHHHILFARNSAYRPSQLERLQKQEPPLFFENWTHDSCLIPIAFYPYWQHRFVDARKRIVKWMERFGDKRVIATVRAHVAENGAVRARDLLHLGGRSGAGVRQRGRWNFSGAPANSPWSIAAASRRSTIWPSGSFQLSCAKPNSRADR